MNAKEILLAHGSGGRASMELLDKVLMPHVSNKFSEPMDDSALLPVEGGDILFTTDSYVVDPPFFPGGDIGRLAVNGTVNDLSVCGGIPRYISLSLILEEGFSLDNVRAIMESVASSASEAGVEIVTGDTKVVGKGHADKVFINTSGIAFPDKRSVLSARRIKQGDKIILSGTIGDHGIAVMLEREGLDIKSDIVSDTAPLNLMVSEMMAEAGAIRFMRDPTRGGLATTLNEISLMTGLGVSVYSDTVPVSPGVAAASEILGLDPFYIANEGKLVAVIENEKAERVLEIIRQNKYGQQAAIIGEVSNELPGKVVLKTGIGGSRLLDILTGDQLPRIC